MNAEICYVMASRSPSLPACQNSSQKQIAIPSFSYYNKNEHPQRWHQLLHEIHTNIARRDQL